MALPDDAIQRLEETEKAFQAQTLLARRERRAAQDEDDFDISVDSNAEEHTAARVSESLSVLIGRAGDKAVTAMKEEFTQRVIRRTAKSSDNTGKRINHIQDPQVVELWVDLYKEEERDYREAERKTREKE